MKQIKKRGREKRGKTGDKKPKERKKNIQT
jgi:hypothetical protein